MHLSDQRGFTLPGVIGLLVVAGALALLAYGAANTGRAASGQSRDGKQAYAAAEAGVNWYLSRLVADNAYWSKCTSVRSTQAPVNNPYNGGGADPRQWRRLPDFPATTPAEYTIELLPANGAAACNQAAPAETMVDRATRTFRIRATGRFGGVKRAITASFRRARFLDFVYLTEYETTDPLNYQGASGFTVAEYPAACGDKLRPARAAATVRDSRGRVTKQCQEIQFANADVIQGPLHSNDSLLTCGRPTFGRSTNADTIETSAVAPGYVRNTSCSGSPLFRPSLLTGVNPILMPTTFASISDAVGSAYRFSGRTYLRLNGTTISVWRGSYTSRPADVTLPWPDNGLVYVEPGASCTAGKPAQMSDTSSSTGCADAYVWGTYGRSLTVASANDVVAFANLTAVDGSDAVAGLIADRFVRVHHPVGVRDGECVNAEGSRTNMTIEAAILAVKHSFTVDNYDCGNSLGTLTVLGGIAQNYRGAVGTGSGTGYDKNYVYDDRFVYRNPPFFLEPAAAAWRIVRMGEQAGPR